MSLTTGSAALDLPGPVSRDPSASEAASPGFPSAERGPLTVISVGIHGSVPALPGPPAPGSTSLIDTVADRLASCLPEGLSLQRLAGAELAFVIEGSSSRIGLVGLAHLLISCFDEPFMVDQTHEFLDASLGMAVTAGERSKGDPVAAAEGALREATAQGPGRFMIVDLDLSAKRLDQAHAGMLADALRAGGLDISFQTIYQLPEGRPVGAEALARWMHPERGWLGAAEFIPLAESAGLNKELDGWVLNRACQALSSRHASGTDRDMWVAVNLSAASLGDPSLPRTIRRILQDTALEPDSVILEIAERRLVDAQPHVVRALEDLKEMGVRLAVDEAGTSSSSLQYLRHLPMDMLKLHRSVVDAVDKGPEARALAHALIKVAQSLGLEVVAVGVERGTQVKELVRQGCRLGQGYFYSVPVAGGPSA